MSFTFSPKISGGGGTGAQAPTEAISRGSFFRTRRLAELDAGVDELLQLGAMLGRAAVYGLVGCEARGDPKHFDDFSRPRGVQVSVMLDQ